MRLWLDEMVPGAVAEALHESGYDVLGVQELSQRWAQGLEDEEQLQAAVRQQRAIATYNIRDFIPISQQWAEARREHLGIVLIHAHTIAPDDIGGLVRALSALMASHPAADALRDLVVFLGFSG